MPFEDVDGGLITHVDNDELEEHEDIELPVHVPTVIALKGA